MPDSDIDLSDIPGDIPPPEFFVYGKTRIKITEHFASDGKQIGDIITELVTAKSKEKVTKIA